MTFDISAMLHSDVYAHPVEPIRLIETHISWVVLTGEFAYKIKKPVNFGFLDFSTLKKRYECCQQEVRLNKRLAADVYIDVVAITGTIENPSISDTGVSDTGIFDAGHANGGLSDTRLSNSRLSETEKAIEYAVKMKQFPQSAQLDNKLAAGKLHKEHISAIALMIANFHHAAKVADNTMNYGNKTAIYQPVKKNFELIRQYLATILQLSTNASTSQNTSQNKSQNKSDNASHSPNPGVNKTTLDRLQKWSQSEFTRQEKTVEQRKQEGFVRECHGDMHLRNLLWLNGKPLAFDCIEFSDELRWIDVISEIAFLLMDLQDRQQDKLANHFLNVYLETTGDYAGLAVLPFYLSYRAMVRAKVAALRLEQKHLPEEDKQQSLAEFASYLQLATRYTQILPPKLIIMRGVSASGKSTVSDQLVDETGAIRIRSDVERKRLFAIPVSKNAADGTDKGIYSTEASQQTYAKLLQLASAVIKAGCSVIIDAAFLKHEQRKPFQQLADQLSVHYLILEITADEKVLRQRIVNRKNDVSDANLAVLEHQLANWQPLHQDEKQVSTTIDTTENTAQQLALNSLIAMFNCYV